MTLSVFAEGTMANERTGSTLADYVALAIAPALIMGLVGSLVFFLLEVLYQGDYQGRMRWILFFFIFGTVLVARISMMGDIAARAGLYGLVLGGLTWLALVLFVKYPEHSPLAPLSGVINLGLVALTWWCAHRLTWDCTHQDEEADATGKGLLQAAHMEGGGEADADEEETEEEKKSWWQRYQRYREKQKKRRTPGVWVVYFSLAALPLFGLGQALIPAEEVARRQYVFWLMVIYVGSGLGLLMTTCFMGLRRYLRVRGIHMPPTMAGVWLAVGALLIVLLLSLGAFLPRPQAEYSPLSVLVGSKERSASRWAQKGGEAGKGEGQPGGEGKGEGQEGKGGKGQKGEKGEGSSQDKEEKDKGGGKSGRDGSSGSGKEGQGGQGKESRGQGGGEQKGSGRSGSRDSRQGRGQRSGRGENSGQRANGEKGQGQSGSGEGEKQGGTQRSLSRLTQVVEKIAPVLKWIVFGLLALVVLYMLLRMGLQFLANFTDWARNLLRAWHNFWANLWGKLSGQQGEEGEEEEEEHERDRPFASFANPFLTGSADRWTQEELIRYTFAAVQAWARDRSLGREPGETPLEFVERMGEEYPALEETLRRLATLYARSVYARGGVPARSAEVLREVWDSLERVVERPLSA
jgi:hypothetical protein